METVVALVILAISIILFFIGRRKKKYDMLVNFLLRTMMGLLAIYLVNSILGVCNVDMAAGMNSINALIVGVLGLPGFLLIYGVTTYFWL